MTLISHTPFEKRTELADARIHARTHDEIQRYRGTKLGIFAIDGRHLIVILRRKLDSIVSDECVV